MAARFGVDGTLYIASTGGETAGNRAVALFSYQYATRAVILGPGSLPFGELAAWLSSWSWALGVFPALTLLPLLFPDGDLPSRRWWPVGAAGLGGTGLAAIGHALVPGPLEDFPSIPNPMGIPALGPIPAGVRALSGPVFVVAMMAGVVAIVVRWRRGDALVRRQRRRPPTMTCQAAAATMHAHEKLECFGSARGAAVW